MNFRRDEFATYYWGDVQSPERDEFIQGRTSSTAQVAWGAWCAAIAASKEMEELSTVFLLLCWEAEQISEGQISALLDLDRVTVRQMRLDAIEAGMKLADHMARMAAA